MFLYSVSSGTSHDSLTIASSWFDSGSNRSTIALATSSHRFAFAKFHHFISPVYTGTDCDIVVMVRDAIYSFPFEMNSHKSCISSHDTSSECLPKTCGCRFCRSVFFLDVRASFVLLRKPAGRLGWSYFCERSEFRGSGGQSVANVQK